MIDSSLVASHDTILDYPESQVCAVCCVLCAVCCVVCLCAAVMCLPCDVCVCSQPAAITRRTPALHSAQCTPILCTS